MLAPKDNTLFFTGHRTILQADTDILLQRLSSAVDVFVRRGYTHFICGGAVGFDTLAAECILQKKTIYSQINLVLALPCRDQTIKWTSKADLIRYKNILGGADHVHYINDFYTSGCMHERNRYMADCSSACIAYMHYKRGGTAYTYNYASKAGLEIINLASCGVQQILIY